MYHAKCQQDNPGLPRVENDPGLTVSSLKSPYEFCGIGVCSVRLHVCVHIGCGSLSVFGEEPGTG